MSTHSNWLQPALKPITMCYSVVSPEIVMPDAYICGRLRRTKITRKASDAAAAFSSKSISSCSILSPEIIMHDNAYIGGRSENNIKCVVHDLGWKNRTTLYILPRHWLYEWFSQFHRCGTYSVVSQRPSIDHALNYRIVVSIRYTNCV